MLYFSSMEKLTWCQEQISVTGPFPPEAEEHLKPVVERLARAGIARDFPGRTLVSLELDTIKRPDPILTHGRPVLLFYYAVVLR
jgi:hypothetical protein